MKSLVFVFAFYVCVVYGLSVELKDGESVRTISIEISPSNSLQQLREQLISNGIIGTIDTKTEKWRFLAENIDNKEIETVEDYVVSINTERRSTIQQYQIKESNHVDCVIFINLKNFVRKRKIKIVRGTDDVTINIDIQSTKLSVLRNILTGKQHHEGKQFTIMANNDDMCVSWRFIDGKSNGDTIKLDEVERLKNVADILFVKYGETVIEIVNELEVNMKTVTIFKGVNQLDIKIGGLRLLSDLRVILSGRSKCYGKQYDFLHTNDLEDWIVLKKKADLANLNIGQSRLLISPDLIVTHAEEEVREIDDVLFNTQDSWFCLEYVNQRGNPGLIGERITEYVTNMGKAMATLKVMKDVPTDDRMDPIMLTNVHATNERIVTMQNVILFEKDTNIRFWIDTQPKTPFWIVIQSGGEAIVTTRGDYGEQFYFAMTKPGMRGRAINVQSNEIRNQGDLQDPTKVRRVVVSLHVLQNGNRRKRSIINRNSTIDENDESFTRTKRTTIRQNVSVCPECKENAKVVAGGNKPTGSGSDAGYGPGEMFATFSMNFLVFRDRDIADKIVRRIALIEDLGSS